MTAPTAPAARRRPHLRRRAIARVGLMAALLVVAGVLPWVSGGPLSVRLLALPLLAAGVFLGAAAFRLHRTLPPMPDAASADTRPAACAGCACGASGGSASGSSMPPCGAAAFRAPTTPTSPTTDTP